MRDLLDVYAREDEKDENSRAKMLASPDLIAKPVAAFSQLFSPNVDKSKIAKHPDPVEALEAQIPSGHPMSGFARDLYFTSWKALQDPKLAALSPNEVIATLGRQKLGQPVEKTGVSRVESSYRSKRAADASWFGAQEKEIPGYKEWLAETQTMELEEQEKSSWLGSIAVAAGLGATAGGVMGGPAGAISGAALWGGAEAVAYPIRQAIANSEWAKANRASDSLVDNTAAFFAPWLADIAGFGIAPKLASRAGAVLGRSTRVAEATKGKIADTLDTIFGDFSSMELNVMRNTASVLAKAGKSSREVEELTSIWGRTKMPQDAIRVGMAQRKQVRLDAEAAYQASQKLAEGVAFRAAAHQAWQGLEPELLASRQEAIKRIYGDLPDSVKGKKFHEMFAVLPKYVKDTILENAVKGGDPVKATIEEFSSEQMMKLMSESNDAVNKAFAKTVTEIKVGKGKPPVEPAPTAPIKPTDIPPKGGRGSGVNVDEARRIVAKTGEKIAADEKKIADIQARLAKEATDPAQELVDNTAKTIAADPELKKGVTAVRAAFKRRSAANKPAADALNATAGKPGTPTNLEELKGAAQETKDEIVKAREKTTGTSGDIAKDLEIHDKVFGPTDEVFLSAGTNLPREVNTATIVDAMLNNTPENAAWLESAEVSRFHAQNFRPIADAFEEAKNMQKGIFPGQNVLGGAVKVGEEGVPPVAEAAAVPGKGKGKTSRKVPVPKDKTVKHEGPTPGLYHTEGMTDQKLLNMLDNIDQREAGIAYLEKNIIPPKRLNNSGKIAFTNKIIEGLGKAVKPTVALGIAGILYSGAVSIKDLFDVPEAHAASGATISKVVEPLFKSLGEKFGIDKAYNMFKEMNFIRNPVTDDQMLGVVRQQAVSLSKLANEKLTKEGAAGLQGAVRQTSGLPARLDRILSTFWRGELGYLPGYNPAIELAMRQQAWLSNIADNIKVKNNFLDRVPGYRATQREAEKAAKDEMAPLADKFGTTIREAQAVEFKLETKTMSLKSIQDKLVKRPFLLDNYANAWVKLEDEIAVLTKEMERYAPEVKAFQAEVLIRHQSLAKRFPGARIVLAAEDTSDFKRYPWLKDMMSREELVATAYTQKMMKYYGAEIAAAGHEIQGAGFPFMHHALHPNWTEKMSILRGQEMNPNVANAIPYSKFYKRSKYSVQMVPEVSYVMDRYIADTEKRLLLSEFWQKESKDGWYAHATSRMVQGSPLLRSYWQSLIDSGKPSADTAANKWLNRYAMFEVAAKIAFAPAVALKHVFKELGTLGTIGVRDTSKAVSSGSMSAIRNQLRASADRGFLKRIGVKGPGDANRAMDEMIGSFMQQTRLANVMTDLDVKLRPEQLWDQWLAKFNDWGSIPVGVVEAMDRSTSILASIMRAQSRGMTTQQAAYGVYETILKNNFLGGMLNPAWIKDPKVRALFLFQSTPFKIFERRIMNGIMTYKDVKTAGGMIKKYLSPTKDVITPYGTVKKADLEKTWENVKGLRKFIMEGEDEFKKNLIYSALTNHKDIFGTPASAQFMREMIGMGAVVATGSYAGLNLWPHVGHLPFLKSTSHDPVLSTSPAISAVSETLMKRSQDEREGQDKEFFLTSFLSSWIGRQNYIPQTANKIIRSSQHDIPTIYDGSWVKYMFSIPAKQRD